MSAFFVSRDVIHDAVTAYIKAFPASRSSAELDALGKAMWKMNAEALVQRYPGLLGSVELDEYFRSAEAYAYHAPNVSPAQIAKSLHCFLYQCCEGNVPETFKLFTELQRLADSIGEPEGYEEAVWDRYAA